MRITFDAAKDARNLQVHGVPLSAAQALEWDALIATVDNRRTYGETRMVGYAPMGQRLYCVVFVDRDDGRRIISLRRANAREVARYEQENEADPSDPAGR